MYHHYIKFNFEISTSHLNERCDILPVSRLFFSHQFLCNVMSVSGRKMQSHAFVPCIEMINHRRHTVGAEDSALTLDDLVQKDDPSSKSEKCSLCHI